MSASGDEQILRSIIAVYDGRDAGGVDEDGENSRDKLVRRLLQWKYDADVADLPKVRKAFEEALKR